MRTTLVLRLFALTATAVAAAAADEVTDWNKILLQALIAPPAVAAPLAQRPAAIVQAAVFDAVNGIERRYKPLSVVPAAPAGASARAAAVQAAHASLLHLFPAQSATFDQQRAISLAAITNGPTSENTDSVQRGIDWGQAVAANGAHDSLGDPFPFAVPPCGSTEADQQAVHGGLQRDEVDGEHEQPEPHGRPESVREVLEFVVTGGLL
jgi:hypothetical protein